jgi:hypothetical protein
MQHRRRARLAWLTTKEKEEEKSVDSYKQATILYML